MNKIWFKKLSQDKEEYKAIHIFEDKNVNFSTEERVNIIKLYF